MQIVRDLNDLAHSTNGAGQVPIIYRTGNIETQDKIHSNVEVLSFDIWNTLIARNPAFSAKRNELYRQHLLPVALQNDHGTYLMGQAIKAANQVVDAVQENQGLQYNFDTRFEVICQQARILSILSVNEEPPMSTPEIESLLMEETYKLFKQYPPLLIEPDFLPTFQWFVERIPVALTSNTGFIPGHVMRDVLKDLGLETPFMYFSNEIGKAKPDEEMFINLMRLPGLTGPENILHIGDNFVADWQGAKQIGFAAIHLVPDFYAGEPEEEVIVWSENEAWKAASLHDIAEAISISVTNPQQ